MSRLKSGDQNCSACSRCGLTRDLHRGSISSLFLYLKLRAMNASTLAVGHIADFSVCFSTSGLWWWFLDPAVDLFSATADWTCYSCLACCLFDVTFKFICCLFAHSASLLINSNNSSRYCCKFNMCYVIWYINIFAVLYLEYVFIYNQKNKI